MGRGWGRVDMQRPICIHCRNNDYIGSSYRAFNICFVGHLACGDIPLNGGLVTALQFLRSESLIVCMKTLRLLTPASRGNFKLLYVSELIVPVRHLVLVSANSATSERQSRDFMVVKSAQPISKINTIACKFYSSFAAVLTGLHL